MTIQFNRIDETIRRRYPPSPHIRRYAMDVKGLRWMKTFGGCNETMHF